ncbi:MAG: trigger factor [Legionellales bacterium]|nr:trigger factor [Legionellales bacterium]
MSEVNTMSVQVEVEQLEGLKRRLTIKISEDQVSSAYQKKLNEVQKNIKIPGFRPGKVPHNVIEQRHGKDLVNETASELIDASFRDALTEHKLSPAAQPEIDSQTFEKNQPVEFSASFEVLPEITLTDLTGVSIDKAEVALSEEDETQALERMLKQHATWNEVDRAVQSGDQLTFDFEGSIDGTPFDGGKSEGFTLEVGSNQMIPGFEDQLIGFSVGDEKDITVTFPETYGVKDLAGKEAVFHIKAHKVCEPQLPEADDEFAKQLGVEEGLDSLKEQLRTMLTREAERTLKNKLHSDVSEALLDKNAIEVPQALIDAEVDHLHQSARQQMAMQQGKQQLPDVELPKEPYIEEATKRVTLGLLLAEVIKTNELKLDQAKLQERMFEMFSQYPNPQQMLEYYQKNQQMRTQLESQVLEEQAIESLLEKADINTVTKAYADVMNPAK